MFSKMAVNTVAVILNSMDVDKAARIILNGIKKEKSIIQFPLPIVFGSKITKYLPDWLFDFLMSKELPARKN